MMMRRASRSSTSRRRDRFNSADSVTALSSPTTNNNKSGGTSFRSRSQERSVRGGGSGSILSPEYCLDADNEHSQADSTAGSNENLECFDVMLEDLDLLADQQQKAGAGSPNSTITMTSIGSGSSGGAKDVIITTTTTTPNNKPKSSSSSILRKSSAHKYHRRSASDPFDISGLQKELDDDDEEAAEETASTTDTTSSSCDDQQGATTSSSAAVSILPTLPRYPVAETRDLNCWSEPKVDIFKVRGKNYLKDKKKLPSAPYLLRARGCDLLLFPKDNGSGASSSVSLLDRSDALLNGTLRKKPTLVLNFRFPWGLMLLHFEIPTKLVPFLHHHAHHGSAKPSLDSLSPGERTLALWFMGDTNYKNQRLKLIPFVVQGPWVVRNLVTGRPAIIGTKLPVTYQVVTGSNNNNNNNGGGASASSASSDLMIVELDIGNSSNTAKRIVSLCRRYMNTLTCDIGFVIQGNTTQELPEQMLGSIRIHGVDPLKAPTFV